MTESDLPPSSPRPPRRQRRREFPQGLPPWRRLRATRDFARVERQGVRAQGRFVAVTIRPGPGRAGFVVSKKVDNKAHERNLVKRRLRAIVRQEKARFVTRAASDGGTVDVVVQARPEAKGVAYGPLRDDVLATLERAIARLVAERASGATRGGGKAKGKQEGPP